MTIHAGRITDDALARLREKLGQRVAISEPPYLTEVTRDAIRHWAWSTGDRNPLFTDEAYARASRYGTMVAPPTILYAFDRLSIGYRGGLPGIHSMFGGSHWRWRRMPRLGDVIHAEVTFKDLIELPSRFAGRMFRQISHISFLTAEGEEIAEAESWGMRTERTKAAEKGKYKSLEFKPYTAEMLADVTQRYAEEKPRGATPLFFEDIAVGDSVPEIIRGPYTATTAVAFEQAWGGLFIWAHGYWFDFLERHPAAGINNPLGVPEPPEAVHWDTELARSVGVPQAYDYGPERIAWLSTMLLNWIGDAGDLKEFYCEMRRFNMIGDLSIGHATVTQKEESPDGRGLVRLDVWATDQRDQTTAKGWALVSLPRR
jgi:acyl dehydratase